MKIASWNVNSVRARQARLLAWLGRHRPDVLCVQETKVADDDFPHAELAEVGYTAVTRGQRAYNGVAILSREPLADTTASFDDGGVDDQARFIAATVAGVRVISVYIPNGQAPGTDAYAFKLEWMRRLRRVLDRSARSEQPLALCGDFNVAPEDRDVWDPPRWHESIMCTTGERNALAEIVGFGLTDSFRHLHAEGGHYSWWDYRLRGYEKDRGLRIDHLYVTAPLVERITAAAIDRDERAGKLPSDHAPIWVELA